VAPADPVIAVVPPAPVLVLEPAPAEPMLPPTPVVPLAPANPVVPAPLSPPVEVPAFWHDACKFPPVPPPVEVFPGLLLLSSHAARAIAAPNAVIKAICPNECLVKVMVIPPGSLLFAT